ncbi:MAG: lysophospholipid acyltransferase family protein [Rikenellaceae bacterium]
MKREEKINSELSFWQRVWLEVLWKLCRVFGLLPHFVQYRIVAPFIYLILYKMIGYRVKVVDANLKQSFPELSDTERKKIRDGFYENLSEVFVSTIAIAAPGMKGKFDDKEDQTSQAAELRALTNGKNWVGLTTHMGLWEHLLFWGEFSDSYIVGAYHKLKSEVMDALFIRLRTRNHPYAVALDSKQILRFCLKNRHGIDGRSFGIGLIADQNPHVYADSQWIKFLGQDTLFYHGGEVLAIKMKIPAYFVYQKRLGKGHYILCYEPLFDGVESVEPYEITRRYVAALERAIRRQPEIWLWSHKRWKHKRK